MLAVLLGYCPDRSGARVRCRELGVCRLRNRPPGPFGSKGRDVGDLAAHRGALWPGRVAAGSPCGVLSVIAESWEPPRACRLAGMWPASLRLAPGDRDRVGGLPAAAYGGAGGGTGQPGRASLNYFDSLSSLLFGERAR